MELPIRLHEYDVLIEGLQPGSVAHQARAILRQALQDAGVATEDVDDAELAVDELAANAETHAYPPYEARRRGRLFPESAQRSGAGRPDAVGRPS
ncbi:ATP-binding protein [Nonomuraea sp. ZG12]|uniref:ATP-binding protein n=1 Tax=Nonomuraea sp. ZG12 TaxID=3452207 RepID=UPI003F8C897D